MVLRQIRDIYHPKCVRAFKGATWTDLGNGYWRIKNPPAASFYKEFDLPDDIVQVVRAKFDHCFEVESENVEAN
jgi:hypothetical protein